jgi:hypothetical protein
MAAIASATNPQATISRIGGTPANQPVVAEQITRRSYRMCRIENATQANEKPITMPLIL